MAAYRPRNCSGWPMSTGQGIKSATKQKPDKLHQATDAFSALPTAIVCSAVIWLLLAAVWAAI